MRIADDPEEVRFGRFRFNLRRRHLLYDGEPVALGGRALDVLRLLVSAEGAVVSKDELMTRLWPGRTVAENNLHVHISTLRKALDERGGGDSYIITVPGRGYRLAHLSGFQPARLNGPSSAQHLPLLDKPAIAVLPFANLSANPEHEYFVDGIVEEITTTLSRIRWLFVMARNSSFIYRGQAIDVKRVGREMGVRYVLEGSVRRSGGQVRITAQLINAENGAHLWADRFDGSLDNIFEIQDLVAARVAGAIEPTLRAIEVRRSSGRPTDDLPAYDLFLRAREHYNSHDRDGFIRALALLEQSIARDQYYGDALALAAQCHATLYVGGWADDADANRRQGVDLAHRALRAAGNDPDVLARAAEVLGNLGEDIDAAIALIERSLAINPNLARGWTGSGWLRLWAGQPELAIEHLVSAQRLNPFERRIELAIGIGHFFARRFDQARVMLLRSLQEFPGWVANYRFLAACYAHMGRLDEAREMVQRLRTLTRLVVPTAEHWRDPQLRELYLSGLRLAARSVEVKD
jgi:TolB-like protein